MNTTPVNTSICSHYSFISLLTLSKSKNGWSVDSAKRTPIISVIARSHEGDACIPTPSPCGTNKKRTQEGRKLQDSMPPARVLTHVSCNYRWLLREGGVFNDVSRSRLSRGGHDRTITSFFPLCSLVSANPMKCDLNVKYQQGNLIK